MSDPVQSTEIEDVLSSIRRLVSNDGTAAAAAPKKLSVSRAAQVNPAPAATSPIVLSDAKRDPTAGPRFLRQPEIQPISQPAPTPTPDRLVLTPSLRIEERDVATPDQPQHEDEQAVDAPQEFAASGDFDDAQSVAEDTAHDWAGEAATPHAESPAEFTDETDHQPETVQDETVQDETLQDGGPHETTLNMGDWAVTPQDEQSKAEPETFDDGAHGFDAEQQDAVDSQTSQADVTDEHSHQDDAATQQAPAAPSADDRAIEARLESWRQMQSATSQDLHQEYEPDEPGDSDYAGTAPAVIEWEDHEDEQDVDQYDEQETVHGTDQIADQHADQHTDAPSGLAAEEDLASLTETLLDDSDDIADEIFERTRDDLGNIGADADSDTAVIDEDMLREMVSDIVRQELQGALGERITRNVRKLVRREIHRALAAHDLD